MTDSVGRLIRYIVTINKAYSYCENGVELDSLVKFALASGYQNGEIQIKVTVGGSTAS